MVWLECAAVDMPGRIGNKWLMILWYAEDLMGWMVIGKESVEKPVEFAFAHVTNVANLYGAIQLPRIWVPQGISIRRIPDRQLLAKDVIVVDHGVVEESRVMPEKLSVSLMS